MKQYFIFIDNYKIFFYTEKPSITVRATFDSLQSLYRINSIVRCKLNIEKLKTVPVLFLFKQNKVLL